MCVSLHVVSCNPSIKKLTLIGLERMCVSLVSCKPSIKKNYQGEFGAPLFQNIKSERDCVQNFVVDLLGTRHVPFVGES